MEFLYPSVVPTHTARFRSKDAARQSMGARRWVRREDDRWWLVRVCPTERELFEFGRRNWLTREGKRLNKAAPKSVDEKITVVISPLPGNAPAAGQAELRTLLGKALAAAKAEDLATLDGLRHPAWRTCETKENKAAFAMYRGFMDKLSAIPVDTATVQFSNDPATKTTPTQEGAKFSIAPTHVANATIDRTTKQGGSKTSMGFSTTRWLRLEKGTWSLVQLCPSKKILALMNREMKAGAVQRQKAAKIVAELAAKSRARVEELIGDDDIFDAAAVIESAAKTDTATAMVAVKSIAKALKAAGGAKPKRRPNFLPATEDVGRLHQAYGAAIGGKSIEAFHALLHPKARACAERLSPDIRDHVFRDIRPSALPDRYFLGIRAIAKNDRPNFIEFGSYTVTATEVAVLSYYLPNRRPVERTIPVARDGSRWALVTPCLDDRDTETIRGRIERQTREAAEAKRQYEALDPKVRAEIERLVKDHRSQEALAKLSALGIDEVLTYEIVATLEKNFAKTGN